MKDFQAQVFCLTGVVPEFSRTDIFDHIAARDGEYVERMTKGVTILVVGERGEGTTKYKKALQYGTEMMPYEDFMVWLFKTPVVDSNAHLRDLRKGSSRKYLCGAHVINPVTGEKNPLPWDKFFKNENDNENESYTESTESTEIVNDENEIENENISPFNCQLSTFLRAAAAVLIIIMRSLVALSAVCLCLCLWCIGIPAKP